MSREGDETEYEDSAAFSLEEKHELLRRLEDAEKRLAEARDKNAELQAINDAYAKNLEQKDTEPKRVKPEPKPEPSALSQEIAMDEMPVTRPAKKAKVSDDEYTEEVKIKKCGKCKKAGHNARTCKI